MRDSNELLTDASGLQERMRRDGYLLLRQVLDKGDITDARRSILEKLDQENCLDRTHPIMDAMPRKGAKGTFRPSLATGDAVVEHLLYKGKMMTFFEFFLGGKVKHFDYTWLRTKIPGDAHEATSPHCDIVYMGRGTKDLYTAWTPLGDVPRTMGGLMVLEGSNRENSALTEYREDDVDIYCTNKKEAREIESGQKEWEDRKNGGMFDRNPVRARETIGGRWLTTDYKMGDLLVFSVFTLHASLNNQTNQIRISTDSRYQLASQPTDERWIGEKPVAHGPEAKIGMIC